MSTTLRETFPRVYAGLLPGFFDHPAPEEKKATCDACAMCPPAGEPTVEGVVYFRPDAKCCTFTPRLPNYLVGAILSDPNPAMAEGRRRVRARIAQRVGGLASLARPFHENSQSCSTPRALRASGNR